MNASTEKSHLDVSFKPEALASLHVAQCTSDTHIFCSEPSLCLWLVWMLPGFLYHSGEWEADFRFLSVFVGRIHSKDDSYKASFIVSHAVFQNKQVKVKISFASLSHFCLFNYHHLLLFFLCVVVDRVARYVVYFVFNFNMRVLLIF